MGPACPTAVSSDHCLAFFWLALRTLTFWGFYMNYNKGAKSLTFWGFCMNTNKGAKSLTVRRGSEVSQAIMPIM